MRCSTSFAARSLAFLATGMLAAGCGFDARAADLRHALQPSTEIALKEQPALLAQLRTGLESRFGTPAEPRYPELASGVGGTGEIDAALRARLRAANRERFAPQLAEIARGELDEVERPRGLPALYARFQATAGTPLPERQARAQALFEDFYPTLAESAELYRIECLHCHGVSGGGDGPTSNFIDPRPRDFRRGTFKWSSVKDQSRPTREDLVLLLDRGVYGTSMPSFRRLSETERQGLADYVRFLAVRGEVERVLSIAAEDEGALTEKGFDEALELVWGKWERAREKVVVWEGEVPEPTPAAIALGARLYGDTRKGNCAACHGPEGRGDGPVAFKLDDRGRRVSAYQDAWGFDILPRNLRRDPCRGGRRPIDLYRRIYAGIQGGPMPAMSSLLSGEEIWALVHYTRQLAEDPDESELAARAGR